MITLDGETLTVNRLGRIVLFGDAFDIRVQNIVAASHELLIAALKRGMRIYGVNTNYGKDVSYIVPYRKIVPLQKNCIRALLCGISPSAEKSFPESIVRGAMLTRVNCFLKGYSAVRPILIETLAEAVERGLIPCVPPYGSMGASGDLAPSAYLANFVFGGFANPRLLCYTPSGIMPISEVYEKHKFNPLRVIAPKECLSMVNNVSFCASIAAQAIYRLKRIGILLGIFTALASQAARCFSEDFFSDTQELRSGQGSGASTFAAMVTALNDGSPLLRDAEKFRMMPQTDIPLQDAYSLGRCAAQHLGTFYDLVKYIEERLNGIVNSVHDNPIVDPYHNRIRHSGNFYAGDIASYMDWMRVEIGKAAKYLHAVVNRLVDEHKNSGLAANLVWEQDGTQNGFKGLNLVETDLATTLSGVMAISPLTVPSERDNQDIVSLGFRSAAVTYERMEILESLMAASLIIALQAFDLRLKISGKTMKSPNQVLNQTLLGFYKNMRVVVPVAKQDVSHHENIENLTAYIRRLTLEALS